MNVKATAGTQYPITLTLTLNEKEAMVLREVVGSVLGSARGPRGMMDEIDDALRNLNVPYLRSRPGDTQIVLPDSWDAVKPMAD